MPMTTKKECVSCGLRKDISDFETARNVCNACRQQQHQKRVSGNPEAYIRSLYQKSKASAKSQRRGIKEFTITAEDLISLYREQEGRCVVSGVILTHHKDGHGNKEFNISIDRIDNTLGYTLDNVRLVAYRLNMMRGGLTNDMFYWWVRTINDFTCK